MRLLLDTHALLWWQQGDRRLSPPARRAIEEADSVLVSAAALWEIVIKVRLGKLEASLNAVFDLGADGFHELPIRGQHARAAGELPGDHKDPFDRIMAAQARVENLTLVSNDPAFASLGVRALF